VTATAPRHRARGGMTLIELLVAMIVAAVVGTALVRLVQGEMRGVEQQEAWRAARAVSRSGVNRLVSDLRMVEAVGGVEAAAPDGRDFTVRVPYAFGLMCSTTGAMTTVSLLPVDSAAYAEPGFAGFAYRGGTGAYTYVTGGAAPTAGAAANCAAAMPPLYTLPGGRVVTLGGAVPPGTPVGSVLFLFRRVRYELKASAIVPGRVGLWRTVVGGTAEELAAPFDTSARVAFYVQNNAVPQAAPPGVLSEIRGLELRLNGASENTTRGSSGPTQAKLATAVFFENRPD
jgi:prepilin-type N-terminal cleavage/methylation domain-containing protein